MYYKKYGYTLAMAKSIANIVFGKISKSIIFER